MWSWRHLYALGISVALHVAVAGGVVVSSVWQGWRLSRNVDIELVATKVTEVKELPLGPPPPPRSAGQAAARRRARAMAKVRDQGVAVAVADAGAPDAGADALPPGDAGGAPDAGPGRADAAPGPRPRDLRDYGPEGSRLTALLRLDRLRDGPQAAATIPAVDQLLRRLPDRRRLIDGTGLDLYRDFDALLIATPNPMDDAVTFLAARHRLSDADLMAALSRGADAAGRPIAWSTDSGRPVGTRRPRQVGPTDAAVVVERDDRLLILPQRGLAIIAPPAYAALLLPGRARAAGGGGVDAGVPPADTAEERWRQLVARIDAEDSALPDGAILMMTASNLLGSGGRARPGRPPPALAPPGGLTLPPFASVVVGNSPRPFLEATAEFERAADARAWEQRWPGLKQTLLGSPLLLLSGFSAIVARTEAQREDAAFTLRTTASQEEMRRVLATITNLMGGGR
jgi:hypothetical protein